MHNSDRPPDSALAACPAPAAGEPGSQGLPLQLQLWLLPPPPTSPTGSAAGGSVAEPEAAAASPAGPDRLDLKRMLQFVQAL